MFFWHSPAPHLQSRRVFSAAPGLCEGISPRRCVCWGTLRRGSRSSLSPGWSKTHRSLKPAQRIEAHPRRCIFFFFFTGQHDKTSQGSWIKNKGWNRHDLQGKFRSMLSGWWRLSAINNQNPEQRRYSWGWFQQMQKIKENTEKKKKSSGNTFLS